MGVFKTDFSHLSALKSCRHQMLLDSELAPVQSNARKTRYRLKIANPLIQLINRIYKMPEPKYSALI